MESIAAIGQQEPIDVLEVDGKYYGFLVCHRFEACQRLGKETIPSQSPRLLAPFLKCLRKCLCHLVDIIGCLANFKAYKGIQTIGGQ